MNYYNLFLKYRKICGKNNNIPMLDKQSTGDL